MQWQLNIIRFKNGMIAVTDDKGKQIPKLQGEVVLAIPRISMWMKRKEHKALGLEFWYWYTGFMGILFTLLGVGALIGVGLESLLVSTLSFILAGGTWMLHLLVMVDLREVK